MERECEISDLRAHDARVEWLVANPDCPNVRSAVTKSARSASTEKIADENVPNAPRYMDAIEARFDGARQSRPLAVAAIQAFCPPML